MRRVALLADGTAEVRITLDLATYSDSVVVTAGSDPKSRLEVA